MTGVKSHGGETTPGYKLMLHVNGHPRLASMLIWRVSKSFFHANRYRPRQKTIDERQ